MSFRHGRHFELFLEQFSLYRGEKIAIVGPNGSGKTSLLRILASLERPTSCEHFFWQGKYRASEQSFGFLRQQPYIFSGTVESNLAYPLQLRGVPRAEIERAMVEILQHLNLSERRYIQARKLSGGEQKRLALGRLLILDPAIMFLDEPIAHLDYHSQHIVQRLLMRTDATLLFTTHDLRFAHLIASRILYLNQGKLVSCSMENMLTGRVEGLRLVTHSGLSIPLPRPVNAASAEVMLRPERLQLSHTPAPVDADGQSAIAQFCGRITAISDHRDAVWLEIDCGELIFVRLSPEQYRELDLNLYREIFVCCDANSVELIS
jgi:ABC-type multidrug transport system ATPase subunit